MQILHHHRYHQLFIEFEILLFLLLEIFIVPVNTSLNKEYICPKEIININGTNIVWPKIELNLKKFLLSSPFDIDFLIKSTLSEPLCFNEHKQLLIRNCTINGWMPKYPPICNLTHLSVKTKNLYCPQELHEIEIKSNQFLCIKISSDEHEWNTNSCYGSNKIIYELNTKERKVLLKFLYKNLNITTFWLPLQRAENKRFNPFIWQLLDDKLGGDIVTNKIFQDNFQGNCAVLTFNISTTDGATTTEDYKNGYGNAATDDSSSSSSTSKNNDDYQINFVIKNCTEKFKSVCIFEKFFFIQSQCPKNYAALSYQPSICYGFNQLSKEILLSNNSERNKNDDHKRKQNYNNQFKDRYDDEIIPYVRLNYLNIVRDDNIYQRFMEFYDNDMSKKHKIDKNFKPNCLLNRKFTKTNENVTYKNELILTHNGKLQISSLFDEHDDDKNSINCCLNVHYLIERKLTKMSFNYNTKLNKLILIIDNYKNIWNNENDYKHLNDRIKCYTNADYEQIRTVKLKEIKKIKYNNKYKNKNNNENDNNKSDHRFDSIDNDDNGEDEDDNDDRKLFEIKLYGDGPGMYWCETHTIFNFELIQTQKLTASKKHKGNSYAFYCYIPCDLEDCYDLHDNMKNYGKRIEKILNELKQKDRVTRQKFKSLIIHNVRIMNIETNEIINGYLRALCHATISLKPMLSSHHHDNHDVKYGSSEEDYLDDLDNNTIMDGDYIRNTLAVKSEIISKYNGILTNEILIRYILKRMLTDLLRTSSSSLPIQQNNFVVNSTEYCLPDNLFNKNYKESKIKEKKFKNYHWRPVKINEISTTFELCLTKTGLPLMRKCLGDFLYGAEWEDTVQNTENHCIKNPNEINNIITKNLYDIEKSNQLINAQTVNHLIKNLSEIITNNTNKLIPADLYYLSNIMNNVANKIVKTVTNFIDEQLSSTSDSSNNVDNVTTSKPLETTLPSNSFISTGNNGNIAYQESSSILDAIKSVSNDIVNIYNNLMDVRMSIIKPSIKVNSTNILLDAFETIIDHIALTTKISDEEDSDRGKDEIVTESNSKIDRVNQENYESIDFTTIDGVSYYFSPKLLVYIIDPSVANISGVALYTNQNGSSNNTDQYGDEPNFRTDRGLTYFFHYSNSYHKFLYSNQSMYDLLFENDIEIAAFAPDTLLKQLIELNVDRYYDFYNYNDYEDFDNDTTDQQQQKQQEQKIVTTMPPFLSSSSPSSLKIVIKIFFNDHLFQEDLDITNKKVFSKIISISIPGYDNSMLPEMFPILMRAHPNTNMNKFDNNSDLSNINSTLTASDDNYNLDEKNNNNSCLYWNYSTWINDGLVFESILNDINLIWCGYSHLTPFAYLIGGTYNLSITADIVIIVDIHHDALDIITLLGCSLSLIGIVGIFITAIIFQSWRKKPNTKILLQLSFAIAIQMILFCFVNTEVLTTHLIENEIYSSCIVLGVLLHYSVLVQFSWMLIIAYLQYKRYVQIIGNIRPKKFFTKIFLIGWCLPLIPIICVLLINYNSYIPYDDKDNNKICYPSGKFLYLAVVLPISIIILANLIIFIRIIYNIVWNHTITDSKTDNSKKKIHKIERKLAIRQLRLSILLFFLLGFTWIFGLLSAIKAGILFSYLFCLTATLQGFIIFLYFIVLDPITRKMWSNFIQKFCCYNNNDQITSNIK